MPYLALCFDCPEQDKCIEDMTCQRLERGEEIPESALRRRIDPPKDATDGD